MRPHRVADIVFFFTALWCLTVNLLVENVTLTAEVDEDGASINLKDSLRLPNQRDWAIYEE